MEQLRIFHADEVRARMGMARCIEVVAAAMRMVTQATVTAPPRTIMPLPDGKGFLAVMPGAIGTPDTYGAKIVSMHPENPGRGRPAVQGFVVLFDHATGAPLALVDGAAVTALRTAAASALATRLLARSTARTLGILGCGMQAAAHLEAICAVRTVTEVRVWGRSPAKARAFAELHGRDWAVPVHAVAFAADAAACDIVCAVTSTSEPVLHGDWVQPGSHVNLVGAHSPRTREADTLLIARAAVFVDSLDAAFVEAGDLLIPIREGAIGREHVRGEIGAVLLERIAGRRNEQEITLYKSLGLVAQDLVMAHAVVTSSQALSS